MSNYKFALSFENFAVEDYVSEKVTSVHWLQITNLRKLPNISLFL